MDAPGLLRIVTEGSLDLLRLQALAPDIDGYVDIALRSGFPEAALRLDSAAAPLRTGRAIWALPSCARWAATA